MATPSNSVSQPQQESRSAKKKKAKAETEAKPPFTLPNDDIPTDHAVNEPTTNGTTEGSNESPYLKELYKNIRNVKKKLNATQKVDSIIAENPDLSLDDLLLSRKINHDQKTQAQKKPSLQASLVQLEEQVAQYKQFDDEYQKRISADKSALEASYKEEVERLKEATLSQAKLENEKESKENLLILSKFLRAAAAKRQGGDETSPENRAFEGALLLIYGGEASAVSAMEKLITGSDELVPTVDQVLSEFTYKQVKELAFEYAPYAAEEAWAEEVAQSEPAPPNAEESMATVGTDPTVAHAGLTEIDNQDNAIQDNATANGLSNHIDTPMVPEASNVDVGAANAAAEENWTPKVSTSGNTGPDGWVEVARDPAETETGTLATPAGISNTQSWAEDVPNNPSPANADSSNPPTVGSGDGFHEVHHGRGRVRYGPSNEYRGGYRGGRGFRGDRGGDGGYRGRGGYRGDRGGDGGYRGRGRGGPRGNRARGEAP